MQIERGSEGHEGGGGWPQVCSDSDLPGRSVWFTQFVIPASMTSLYFYLFSESASDRRIFNKWHRILTRLVRKLESRESWCLSFI